MATTSEVNVISLNLLLRFRQILQKMYIADKFSIHDLCYVGPMQSLCLYKIAICGPQITQIHTDSDIQTDFIQ